MLYTHNVLHITLLHLNTAKNCDKMKQSRAKHQFFFLSDMLILSSYKQPTHGSLPKHLNQSAWQDASNSCLIDALIQSLSTAALWSLPKANTTHTSHQWAASQTREWSWTDRTSMNYRSRQRSAHSWAADLWPETTLLSYLMTLQGNEAATHFYRFSYFAVIVFLQIWLWGMH